MASTSHATISRILNHPEYPVSPELKERVLAVVKECNYIPNLIGRSLKTQSVKDIGVITPNFSNPFYALFLANIEKQLHMHGYQMLIVSSGRSRENEYSAVRSLIMRRVSAIVMLSHMQDEEAIRLAESQNNTVIILNDRIMRDNVINIYADSVIAGKKVTEHLLELGHREIGYISLPLDRYSRKAFRQGYIEALYEYGQTITYEVIGQEATITASDIYEYDQGVELTYQMMAKYPHITAIIASNDYLAMGAVFALNQLNLSVPDQISVAGRDNIPAGQIMSPQLTTFSEPIAGMSSKIIEILETKAKKTSLDAYEKNNVFQGKMIIRASTASR